MKDINIEFKLKISNCKAQPAPKKATEQDTIHSKSEKVCGVCFSVTKKLRKKCVNLDIKFCDKSA